MLESKVDFEVAYKTYSPRIYLFLVLRTRDRELAEDLTSSVFEKAWQSRASFKGGSVQAWLYRIARNTLTDYWRKKKEMLVDDDDEVPDERPSLSETLDKQMEVDRLRTAVAKLSPQVQEIITKRFIERQSVRQVATELGLSEANLRVVQYRALKQLRKYLS